MAGSQAQAETRSAEMVEPADFFQVGQDDGVTPRLYLRYDLFRAIEEFALKDTSRELAGLLLGRSTADYTLVEEAVECGISEEGGRFTARVFQYSRRIARHRYPELKVLGWFHTHPGSGLELSEEEREVHRAQFPESGQLLYVEDPVQRDRNFHRTMGTGIQQVGGFRIYGKETFKDMTQEATPVRADDHLKERYLERSLEKIQRMLRRPVWQLKDTIIILLLLANLLALIFLRPGPATVTVGGAPATDKEVMKTLADMSNRLTALEEHLRAMQVIDEELMTSPSPTPVDTAAVPPPPSTPGKARTHKVKSGDTLGRIAEKYYGTSDPKVLKALARANGLKSPNYDMFVGETLKIPDKKDLK